MPEIAALQIHVQHSLVGTCLCALARLRIADHVDGRRGLEEIAARAWVDPSALRRRLRFLEPHSFFEQAEGRVPLTGKSRLFRLDRPVWPMLYLRGANHPAWHLHYSLKAGETAFRRG